jgi:hypothetical protein
VVTEFTGTRSLADPSASFDTFRGVTRPALLAVLGAMLYLREGWLVGNCGLGGALLIIGAAYTITGTTVLSVASVATNTRVRSGGAFAIIAQALGVEVGGAIGIPLFLAQSASAAMYLFAFTEAFGYLFPEVDTQRVVVVAYLVVAGLSWLSASLAFRAQGVLLGLAVLALLSIFGGLFRAEMVTPVWSGTLAEASMRDAFAIFFPASTGLLVGVGMSGSLLDPRKSIPRGTLTAWGVTLVVYVLAAFWYAVVASPEELLYEKTLSVSHALVPMLVLVGLLGSTLMAATSSMVAAPRLLQAMAAQRAVPWGHWLEEVTVSGEPRNASVATTSLVGLFLLSGSLDAIAPIVTAFFMVTYLALNLVVFLEQRLGMISFRPTFQIPNALPLVGVAACLLGLMACSPTIGLTSLVFVGVIYRWLHGQDLHTPWETVRSGVAVTVADWAARRAAGLERSHRAWKPDLLVPVMSGEEAASLLPFLEATTRKNGSVKLVGLVDSADLYDALEAQGRELSRRGIYSSFTVIDGGTFSRGALLSMDAMRGAFFPPNLVVLDASKHDQGSIQVVLDHCLTLKLGLAVVLPHPDGTLLGSGQRFEVWLSDRSPRWRLHLHNTSVDLPVLLAYLLSSGRGGVLKVSTVVGEAENEEKARMFLHRLIERGRLPESTRVSVQVGDFLPSIEASEPADVRFYGLSQRVDLGRLRDLRDASQSACVFLLDSGHESLLA